MKNEVISDNIELESSGEAEPSPEEQILFKGLHFQRWININMVRIFFVLWISVSLVALVPLLRPAVSVTEKRELHKFPSFSFSALFSGNYFSDIGLWYSDTFPLRDTLTELNGRMKYILGAGGEEIHGEVISAESDAEQLPDTQIRAEQGPEIQSEPEPEVVVEQLGAIAIIDNAGYEYYNFNKEAADIYISAVNRAADLLVGKARVFNTVIPTSIAVTLDQRTASRLNSSDQKAAMDYINSNLSQNAVSVDSYGILSQHKDEYIYFRTDHHWTALGAYYSYTKLMNAAGLVPADLSLFEEYIFGGFLGTFYATSKMSPKLGNTPDTVYAYEPPGLKYIHTYESGYEKDYRIVSNGDDLTSSEKYLTFVCGDHPLGVVVNEQIADNSSCLIIKESFGNPMISYFTQNYHTTFVIDYRKIRSVYGGNLITFVEEHAVNDVYFINNISATRSPKLTGKISDFVPQIQ